MAVRYEKPDPGPEKFGELLARLFLARGWGEKTKRAALEEAWTKAAGEIAGPVAAKSTKPGALRKGVLEIHVRDTILVHEMTQFHKRPLLARLRELLPQEKIGELRIRLAAAEFRPKTPPNPGSPKPGPQRPGP